MQLKEIVKSDGVIIKFPIDLETNFIMFGFIEISVNKSTEEHFHEEGEEFLYVVEGEGDIFLNRKRFKLRKGFLIFIRSGIKHRIFNTNNKILKLVFGISPAPSFG